MPLRKNPLENPADAGAIKSDAGVKGLALRGHLQTRQALHSRRDFTYRPIRVHHF